MDNTAKPTPRKLPRRIRGLHRRRVLFALSRSDLTVSEISRKTGLRMPHVSAEIRKLRADGMVQSASAAGTRGASIFLTIDGREEVLNDILHRTQSCIPIPPGKNEVCLISRDNNNLILASTTHYNQSTIAIPDRPLDQTGSNGNYGVQWMLAEVQGNNSHWINPYSKKMVGTPEIPTNPNAIESFSEGDRPVYVFHARIIGENRPISVAPGTWFSPRFDLAKHPFTPQPGFNLRLGTLHPDVSPVYAPDLLVIDIEGRTGQTLITRIIPDGYLTISSMYDGKDTSSSIPEDVLDYWIKLAHPRTRSPELRRRSQALKDRISLRRRSRVPEETLRRFRTDWGNTQFEEKEPSSENISMKDLGLRARRALIEWVMEMNVEVPVAVEISEDIPEYVFKEFMRSVDKGIVFVKSSFEVAGIARLSSDPSRPLPWARYTDPSGIGTRLSIQSGKLNVAMMNSPQFDVNPHDRMPVKLSEDEASNHIIQLALNEKHEQDEEWANIVESEHPIAALIATPRKYRWKRWKRIKGRIDGKWMHLLEIEDIPTPQLYEFIENSDVDRYRDFSMKFSNMVKSNPNFAFEVRPMTSPEMASKGAAWIASRLLASASDIPSEMIPDLLTWAIPSWLQNLPITSIEALSGACKIIEKKDLEEFLDKVHTSAATNINSDIHIWSRFCRVVAGKGRLTPPLSVLISRHLPLEWFAPLSEQILLTMLRMDQWWSNADVCSVPWAGLILRPRGEVHYVPGCEALQHPGVEKDLLRRIEDSISSGPGLEILEEPSLAGIFDLVASLRSSMNNTPPSVGRSHPMIGWLAHPRENWPDMAHMDVHDGDPLITARLLMGRSGYSVNEND